MYIAPLLIFNICDNVNIDLIFYQFGDIELNTS